MGSDASWPPRVDADVPLIRALTDEIKRRESDMAGRKVTITAVAADPPTASAAGGDALDVAVLPANLHFPRLSPADAAAFVEHALVASPPPGNPAAAAAAVPRAAGPFLLPTGAAAAAGNSALAARRVALVCEHPPAP